MPYTRGRGGEGEGDLSECYMTLYIYTYMYSSHASLAEATEGLHYTCSLIPRLPIKSLSILKLTHVLIKADLPITVLVEPI